MSVEAKNRIEYSGLIETYRTIQSNLARIRVNKAKIPIKQIKEVKLTI